MIITLCGSTRFKKEYEEANKMLSLEGHLIFSCAFFKEDSCTQEQKALLDELHLRKITRSDAIYVINKNRYIGKSTRNEIAFAKRLNKIIMSLRVQGFED